MLESNSFNIYKRAKFGGIGLFKKQKKQNLIPKDASFSFTIIIIIINFPFENK